MAGIIQRKIPERVLFTAGERVTFCVTGLPGPGKGTAVLRTNLGRAALHREELIRRTEEGLPPPGLDWHDVPMIQDGHGGAALTLPLPEVGIFEAKCCFIPSDGSPILWAQGENFVIKTDPAEAASGNSIYCAFVRQFGPHAEKSHAPAFPETLAELDRKGYTVIPPSGTFRNLIARLDHIFGLGCRILQLLPVHPIPSSYGRMGRYGSPFAATDYFAVDPALADFDTAATPMEQFGELIDAVHARNGRIFMDIPVNHTGWASKLQEEHPGYFVRRADGTFESPGAWGVVWADLCKLNYNEPKVHELMAKVFLFWCRRGVDGFRCDAGYMLPPDAWEYIVSRVRREYPDTVFLLEGLGGPLPRQEQLLGKCGLNWGYSELFQNYSRDEITRYLPYMEQAGNRCGTLVSFAETHDNARLAASGIVFARLRFLVTALLAQHGAFGFANGAEFFAAEKIDVHGCGALNFGAESNLVGLIRRLNALLARHPAFGRDGRVTLIQRGGGNVIAALRSGPGIPPLLVLLNLDCNAPAAVEFPRSGLPAKGRDLLSGKEFSLGGAREGCRVELAAGEGLCLSFDDFELQELQGEAPGAVSQRADAMAQRIALRRAGLAEAAAARGEEMCRDPEAWVAGLTGEKIPPVCCWNYPQDLRRVVMAAPGDVILLKSPHPFRAQLEEGKHTRAAVRSVTSGSGEEFALLLPPRVPEEHPEKFRLSLTVFTPGGTEHGSGTLLLLPPGEGRSVPLVLQGPEAKTGYAFGSNEFSSYALFSADWGRMFSKYEALLAVNPEPAFPSDRKVLFSRCRAWLVVDDFSQELTGDLLRTFSADPGNRAQWRFQVPTAQGVLNELTVDFAFASGANAMRLTFRRPECGSGTGRPGKLILRPDVEDRVNHLCTAAYTGPERAFPAEVRYRETGFDFCGLSLRGNCGTFQREPEWHYMNDLPRERDYGLQDKTDLFSPGYFSIPLPPGGTAELTASYGDFSHACWPPERPYAVSAAPEEIAEKALRHFFVRRDGLSTVIAGYPWFLDWGRDTLIVLRGAVHFPQFRKEAEAVLRRFAAFERKGTIPNMIQGGNDSNRDTSDAPLYLILAARELVRVTGKSKVLEAECGGRTLREVLHSIVHHYQQGTPNGIVMDPESKLIFSPSHFTWMDTNFPAGTPREGYPIEIQALWFAVLEFLGYGDLAREVSRSVEKLYFTHPGLCSDCLHASRGTPAARAEADDHIRCNALSALTLGALSSVSCRRIVLRNAGELLVPGGIRTLADRPVRYHLPVMRDGQLLNDPCAPYRGHYCGPEDTARKAAYHNGTAWPWPFPAYCEAWAQEGGKEAKKRALALLMSAAIPFAQGIPGQLPEVMDGDAPHRSGGCPAQAWSLSEFLRVWQELSK